MASLIVVVTAAAYRLTRQDATFFQLGRLWSPLFMPICFGWCHDNNILNDNHKDPLLHLTSTGSQPLSLDNTSIEIEERIGPRKTTTSIVSEFSATNSKEGTNKAPNLSSVWNHIYWKNPKLLFEDILTMGNCLFGGAGLSPIVDHADGNEQDFHNRYIEDRVLGEGEFGVVKLVHDMREPDESKNTLACKVLRKGVVFKGS